MTILERIRSEPAVVIGFVQAALALALSFGVELSTEQVGAVLAFTAAVLGFVVRSQVFPTKTVHKIDPAAVVKD